MRIDGAYYIGAYAPVRERKRAGVDGTFSVEKRSAGASRVATQATAMLADIESMLALQGIEDDPRERGMRRGNAVLDLLEELKIALLEGDAGGGRLDRLASLVAEAPEDTGIPGLDDVIAAVDLRARVELAKRGR